MGTFEGPLATLRLWQCVALVCLLFLALLYQACSPAANQSQQRAFPETATPGAVPAAPVQVVPTPRQPEPIQLFALPTPLMAVEWATANNTKIFWTSPVQFSSIVQYPIAGGEISAVVSTTFPQGTVGLNTQFFASDEWLVYLDAATQNLAAAWRLFAFQLPTKQATLIAESLDQQWSLPDFAFDGQRIVWTVLVYPTAQQPCTQTLLVIYDLALHQQKELDRHCIEDSYLLDLPVISQNFIAAAKTTPDLKSDIAVWNLATNTQTLLTTDGHSSMPAIDYPWVAWKNSTRYENAQQTGLYNLQTGEHYLLDVGLTVGEPSLAEQRWLYWSNQSVFHNPVYVYDLAQRKIRWLAQPNGQATIDESIHGVNLFGQTIIWHRDDLLGTDRLTSTIEWAKLP